MRQQIDLRCLQSSVSSPLTLEGAAAEQLRTCKINKRGKGPHLFQNKREKVPTLFLHLEHLLLRRHWKQYRHIPNNLCESTQPWVSSFLKIPIQFCLVTWLFSLESRKHNIFKCVHTKLPSKMLIQCRKLSAFGYLLNLYFIITLEQKRRIPLVENIKSSTVFHSFSDDFFEGKK